MIWFGFVSQIEVSVKQQDEITPLIRNYLANLEKWSKGGAVKMKSLMDKAKGFSDHEMMVVLAARAKAKAAPRAKAVAGQAAVKATAKAKAKVHE